ncbi:MAG: hypothetical protein KTV16_16365, partial [Acidimicrobiia bacterium]|nr:hypothetical protein [Acidimicrobiia bacterium]
MKKIISTSFVVASCLCLLLILPATAVHPPRTLSFEEIVSGQIEDDGGEMQDINLDASVNLCYNVKAFQLYEGDTRHFPGETWIYDKHDR